MSARLFSAAARSAARAPAARSTVQRRFASTDNAFVREREAAKHHAAGTTVCLPPKTPRRKLAPTIEGIPTPSKTLLMQDVATEEVACIPALALAGANAYVLWNEHWEHWSHMPPLEERVEYPYQNIRTKNYQWGNGDKTLFWNDSVNYHNKDKA
ncbi:hypothetical protein KNSL1_003532 [Colletotrichum chrysophilum]|nr:hypothetical protein Brms1b_005613 [Colletotrichum noveboracense]KAJ0351119.1 hypothetical protein KNSL1_003532 [Colletotrichum chrysophilum]